MANTKHVSLAINPNSEDLLVPGNQTVLQFRRFSGKSSKPPIVLLHGLTGNLAFMEPLAKVLQNTKRTVYTYDLRGRGKSEIPDTDYSAEIHASDLEHAFRHLEIPKAILVAHSLGCWIALEFAKKHPEKVDRMVLLDGGGNQTLLQKIRNLRMVQKSLTRLEKIFPSREDYYSEIAGSPFFSTWKKEWEKLFDYELVSGEGESVRCNIPIWVMQRELQSLGGNLTFGKILKDFLRNPKKWIQITQKRKNIAFEKIKCRTLVVRALKKNVSNGDMMLPDKTYHSMLRRLPSSIGLSLHDTNHYGLVMEEHPILYRELLLFCD